MSFWAGDTALEVGSALARADLSNQRSFEEAVTAVKTYVRAKMQKYKSVAPALPGGKLEALEKKYAPLGFQDVFYVARFELKLPASALALPPPSPHVRQRLEAAGFPLPADDGTMAASVSTGHGLSSPVQSSAASIRTTTSSGKSAPKWVTQEDFAGPGVPYTRETLGLAAHASRKAHKEAQKEAAVPAAAPPLPAVHMSSPAVPRPPLRRAPSAGVPGTRSPTIDVKRPLPDPSCGCLDHPPAPAVTLGLDAKISPPCGCLDHAQPPSEGSVYSQGTASSSEKKSGEGYREPPLGDSPTLPLSPLPMPPLELGSAALGGSGGDKPRPGPSLRDTRRPETLHIRDLFAALPPETQLLALERFDARRRAERQQSIALAADADARLAADERRHDYGRRLAEERRLEEDRAAAWERAKGKGKQYIPHSSPHFPFEIHGAATAGRRNLSPDLPGLQPLLDALPTPPARGYQSHHHRPHDQQQQHQTQPQPQQQQQQQQQQQDTDGRRMIEARIAALQSALAAMGIEPGSPPLPPTPSPRSPVIAATAARRNTATSAASTAHSHYSVSPTSTPILTPRSPFAPLPATPGSHHPYAVPSAHGYQKYGAGGNSSPRDSPRAVAAPTRRPSAPPLFDLDEHLAALCRASDGSLSSQGSGSAHLLRAIAQSEGATVGGGSTGGGTDSGTVSGAVTPRLPTPPPSYTFVDTSFVDSQAGHHAL